jgi:outer membrane protein TolC
MSFKKLFLYFAILAIFCKQSLAQNPSTLSLDQYLEQVKGQNLTIEKSEKNVESFELLKQKAKLVSAVKLYGFSESSFAEQNRALQFFRYQSVQYQNNRIGLSQNSEFGLNSNIYYSLNNTKYKGFNSALASSNLAIQNSQAIPVIELSIPLWQNLFGASTRARRDASFFENEAQKLSAKALSIAELIDAEKGFWTMVFAQKTLEIQNRALNSAQKILNYLSKKERMNLAEKGDVLQAKAMVESKKLAVKQAENFLKISARNFNKKRNIENENVQEKLISFDIQKLQNTKFSTQKKSDRLDVKSQKAQVEASVAQSKIEEENNKPSLNLYTSYSVNQVEANRVDAVSSTLNKSAPTGKIGLEFSMPINIGLSSDIRKGARIKASADKISYREKLLQQEIDWQNLQENLKDYQENLRLATQIENAQKAKLENERNLLTRGRTSTYQILVFEQEYSNSELTTQQIAQKLQELIAEQKLYQQLEI